MTSILEYTLDGKQLSSLGVTPYKHQLEAVQFWLDNQGRGYRAWDGDLKLFCHPFLPRPWTFKDTYFIPAGLRTVEDRLNRLLSTHEVIDYDGKNSKKTTDRCACILCDGSEATAHIDRHGIRPEIIICDECHYIKSPRHSAQSGC